MHQKQILHGIVQIKPWFQTLLKAVMGSILIALCAQISIPLPFTPVPLTGHVLAILFLGGTLGSKQAAACTILYLLEATAGLPVLACGTVNPMALVGPRGGYLLAMPVMAYIAGKASVEKSPLYNFAILISACFLVLILGSCALANFVGWRNAFPMGMYPFIAGDALKSLLITFYLAKKCNQGN